MRTKVLFQSKKGNTRKIAEAIADELGTASEAIPPAYMPENMDLLFIGGGVYGGKLDKKMASFLDFLDTKRVRNVALFGTSGAGDYTGIKAMKAIIEKNGINVIDESFACKGKMFGFFNRKCPTDDDIQSSRDFAKKVIEGFSK